VSADVVTVSPALLCPHCRAQHAPVEPHDRMPTAEAARYVGLAESTLRYYRHAGIGPTSYRIGSKGLLRPRRLGRLAGRAARREHARWWWCRVSIAISPVRADDTGHGLKAAQNPTAAAGMASCAEFAARWSGLKTAHCAGCHQTFSVVSAFDRHLAGSHPQGTRHCLDPATVGLCDAGRAYPCWSHPGRTGEADE
jgi:hypothetical protein